MSGSIEVRNGTYATDGKCHNSNIGTYNHECGKPATWIGKNDEGFSSGFCDNCKAHGDEARHITQWRRRGSDELEQAAASTRTESEVRAERSKVSS